MSPLARESFKLAVDILAVIERSPLDIPERLGTANVIAAFLLAQELDWDPVALARFSQEASQENFNISVKGAFDLRAILNHLADHDDDEKDRDT